MKWQPLTPQEEKVIVQKGTEAPFSGEYHDFDGQGVYLCRRCQACLFRSTDKFHSGCGWPAFDDDVAGAVKRVPDRDGQRTEIICRRCSAHLGHVFNGERLTPKDTRHCVNSLSMQFSAYDHEEIRAQAAYFGGGCFWCLEAVFLMLKGVLSVTSGYAGGQTEDPGYEQVCRGDTGHAEVVRVEFDPAIICYEALLDIFFAIHDPTQLNRQGADAGTQYRSIILYAHAMHGDIAREMISAMGVGKNYNGPIVTQVQPFEQFYPAENAHQGYFIRNPGQYYCQAVISPKIAKIKQHYKNYLK